MSKQYRRTNNYQLRKIANQIMLFPVGRKADDLQGAIILNELSEFIWKIVDKPKTIEDIFKTIIENYEVENEDYQYLIIQLLDEFVEYEVFELC